MKHGHAGAMRTFRRKAHPSTLFERQDPLFKFRRFPFLPLTNPRRFSKIFPSSTIKTRANSLPHAASIFAVFNFQTQSKSLFLRRSRSLRGDPAVFAPACRQVAQVCGISSALWFTSFHSVNHGSHLCTDFS